MYTFKIFLVLIFLILKIAFKIYKRIIWIMILEMKQVIQNFDTNQKYLTI